MRWVAGDNQGMEGAWSGSGVCRLHDGVGGSELGVVWQWNGCGAEVGWSWNKSIVSSCPVRRSVRSCTATPSAMPSTYTMLLPIKIVGVQVGDAFFLFSILSICFCLSVCLYSPLYLGWIDPICNHPPIILSGISLLFSTTTTGAPSFHHWSEGVPVQETSTTNHSPS